MSPPDAAVISIRATLAMLDGPKKELAEGVSNDRYVFWLGSGISRERMPDLRDLAKRVLTVLQARIAQGDPDCRYRRTLAEVVALAVPSEDEAAGIDHAQSPDQWPAFEALASRLVSNYARMLNVPVAGEEPDFLLWDVLDAANVYSNPAIEPDAEHLCLAALGIEGVASEMPSANWDSLIERAMARLAGAQPILRVAVAPEDVRSNRRRANLYKFHGCAKSARDDSAGFRRLLVARQSQINGWIVNNLVMANTLMHLIVTKPTLMLGLSAQDSNIQGLFAAAQAQMAWNWPAHPPAYAFAENALGADQEGLLQNVYHAQYSPAVRPQMEEEALVQAYAKPLLLALFLYVLTAKLKALVVKGVEGLDPVDRDKLHQGLDHARNHVADRLVPTALLVGELLQHVGRTMTMLRDGALPDRANGSYMPVTADPVDRIPADPTVTGSGVCQFAVAAGLIGIGLDRALWTAERADPIEPDSGAFVLSGRSGPARIYFAATPRAAIRLGTNGLIADNDDAIVIHSHEALPRMARSPRRPPGRTGLASVRTVSIEELLAGGSEVEDLLERFRNKVAL